MTNYDVVIIGAGITGAMAARELSRYDLKLCILEAASDVAMGATKANSAIVHAGFDAKEGTLKAKFNVEGSKMFEQVCKELGAKYKRIGALVVGFSDEDKKTLRELLERGERNGVEELRLIESREELLKIEPNIGEGVTCALLAPTSAITCPYELCIAAVGNAMDNGAELKLSYKVESIVKGEDEYIINNELKAKVVINAAGCYADEIARMVGDDSFTITPRRGEYVLLDREAGGTAKHTVFRCPSAMGKGVLVTPTVDGNLLLGPTAENIEDKDDKTTTLEGQAFVKKSAKEQVAGIDLRKSITSFTGLRSVGSTGDFIITEPVKGFINAAAIESPGLSSAPAIAVYLAEMVGKDIELKENKDFVPCRKPAHYFSEMSLDEKNEKIKEDPSFGHIICRCETVTEGEILEALRTNPKPTDLDGIKRRTRAQMGRCQGGFCSPYIVELIAKELGIDETEVTKTGGESKILIGRTKAARR